MSSEGFLRILNNLARYLGFYCKTLLFGGNIKPIRFYVLNVL